MSCSVPLPAATPCCRPCYDWFQDKLGTGKPTTAEGIIVLALDNVIAEIGLGPYNVPRGYDTYGHALLGQLDPAFKAVHADSEGGPVGLRARRGVR